MSDQPDIQQQASCLNCGAAIQGEFCAACGQQVKEVRRPFVLLIQEMLFVVLELDGRAYRTIYRLMTRPGFLSKAYVSGRRAHYTPPLRLFLIISIGLFLMISLGNALQTMSESLQGIESPGVGEITTDELVEDIQTEISDEDMGEFYNFIDDFNVPFLSEESNSNLKTVMRRQGETNLNNLMEDPEGFLFDSLDYVTVFMLLMMPLLAMIQNIIYFPARRYYIEHLVLTLHNQAFVFFAIFLMVVTGFIADLEVPVLSPAFNLLETLIMIWVPIYLFLSLRVFFGSGYFLTFLAFITMSLIYIVALSFGFFVFGLLLFFLF